MNFTLPQASAKEPTEKDLAPVTTAASPAPAALAKLVLDGLSSPHSAVDTRA